MNTKLNTIKVLKIILVIVVFCLSLPYINIILLSLKPNSKYLNFIIKSGTLSQYTLNTLELIVKVGFFSALIGFIGAYFMIFYSFKFKRLINLLFILPLSIPIYVGAYVYSDLFDKIPILETVLKNDFTMNSTVFIYTIFLYPYVYLASYAFLKAYLQNYIEVAKTLKLSNFRVFYKIIFPLSKSIIFSSTLFVIYESLSDFAVSEYYGTLTLSRAFNDAWRVSADTSTSAKLALTLIIIITFILHIEKTLRKKVKLESTNTHKARLFETDTRLKTVIYTFFTLIISLGFILPFQKILKTAIKNSEYLFKRNLFTTTFRTFMLSLTVIILILIISMFISSMLKYLKKDNQKKLAIFSNLGYMMPSMILALGLYSILFKLDLLINPVLKYVNEKYIFTSTSLVLIIGLTFKFLALSFNNFEKMYKKINKEIFETAFTLGQNPIKTFFKIDLYFLLKTSKVVIIVIMLDVFKELTLAFTLSPFNFRTISMEIYYYMANEMPNAAYVPSSIIVFICILCVLVLERNFINDKNK